MATHPLQPVASALSATASKVHKQAIAFVISGVWFRLGLAFVTFEEVRPFGLMLSDYCFGLSLLFLPKSLFFKVRGSGILMAASLILAGAVVSLHQTGSVSDALGALAKPVVLYGLIAPLALCHSKEIYKNLKYLLSGIFVNCLVTLVQASVFPKIVDVLSINPPQPDVGFSGRYQGLTEFPVTLGLSAALAVLIALGLFYREKSGTTRAGLIVVILVCSIAALLSGSRTFLASLIPGCLVLVLLQKQRRRGVLLAFAGLCVLWGAVIYLAPGVVAQYSDRVGSVGLVDYNRLATAAQAAMEISQKPLLGWGVDHFEEGGLLTIPETGEVASAHNTFLRYWYAAGLLGAIGFLALFFLPAKRMVKALKAKVSDRTAGVVRLILACYVFFFIVSNLGPYFYNRYLYVPMFVLAGFIAHVPVPDTVAKPVKKNAPRPATRRVSLKPRTAF
jgi:O-antigen ligase